MTRPCPIFFAAALAVVVLRPTHAAPAPSAGPLSGRLTLSLEVHSDGQAVTAGRSLAVGEGQLTVHALGQRLASVTLIAAGGREVVLEGPYYVGIGRPATLRVPVGNYVGVVLVPERAPGRGGVRLEARATYRGKSGDRATYRMRIHDLDDRESLVKEFDQPLVVTDAKANAITLDATLERSHVVATRDVAFDGWRSSIRIASVR